jgi:hypothetical protein
MYSIYIKQINQIYMKNDVSAIPAGKSNNLKRLLFLLVCVLMSGNAVWAQQPTITIHAKNQSLKEVLKEIEQQSKHSFIYSSSTINVNQKVNLECNGVSLDKALEHCRHHLLHFQSSDYAGSGRETTDSGSSSRQSERS